MTVNNAFPGPTSAGERSRTRQLIASLVTLQLLFGVLYAISLINIANNETIIASGVQPLAEHAIISLVVVISTINIIIELKKA